MWYIHILVHAMYVFIQMLVMTAKLLIGGGIAPQGLRHYSCINSLTPMVAYMRPYLGFRYTLSVPTVRWVHLLYLKPLVCIPFSTEAI
jgi:hypothetical protein